MPMTKIAEVRYDNQSNNRSDNRSQETYKKPVYLLYDKYHVGELNNHRPRTDLVKKCMCAECNNVFDLDRELRIRSEEDQSSLFPNTEYNISTIIDTDSVNAGGMSNDNCDICNISCPECGNSGVYTTIKRSDRDNSWQLPYVIKSRELSKSDDDKIITDSCVYSAIQISDSGEITQGSVTVTETVDLDKKSKSVTCEHDNDGRYYKNAFEKKAVESEDLLSSKKSTKPKEKMSDKEAYVEKYRTLDPEDGKTAYGRLLFGMKNNPVLGMDVCNPLLVKEWRTNPRFRSNAAIISVNGETAYNERRVGNLQDRTVIQHPEQAATLARIFMPRFGPNPDDNTKAYEAAKRHALESSFKGKFNLPSRIEDICFDSSKNNLYARSHKIGDTEATTGANDKFAAVYSDLMVRYPAVLEMACLYTKRDVTTRAKDAVMKDKEFAAKANEPDFKSQLQTRMNDYINNLPDTAIARHFRENMFNFASQVYACDDNIRKECANAKNAKELYDTLKFYAFGPEIDNPVLGSHVNIPEHVQKNAKKNNTPLAKQTAIQNDPGCINEFLKHPIGFANSKYTLIKTFGKSLSEEQQAQVLSDISDYVNRNSGVKHKPKIQEDSLAYYKTSPMIHDFTISSLPPECKAVIKSTIEHLKTEEISRIYTDDVGKKYPYLQYASLMTRDTSMGRSIISNKPYIMSEMIKLADYKKNLTDHDFEIRDDISIEESKLNIEKREIQDCIRTSGIEAAYVRFAGRHGKDTEDIVNTAAREMFREDSLVALHNQAQTSDIDSVIEQNKELINKLGLDDPAAVISNYERPKTPISFYFTDKNGDRLSVSNTLQAVTDQYSLAYITRFKSADDAFVTLSDEENKMANCEIEHDGEKYTISAITNIDAARQRIYDYASSDRRGIYGENYTMMSASESNSLAEGVADKKIIACDITCEYMDEPIGNMFIIKNGETFKINGRSYTGGAAVASVICDVDFIKDIAVTWSKGDNVPDDQKNVSVLAKDMMIIGEKNAGNINRVECEMKQNILLNAYGENENGEINLPTAPDDLKAVYKPTSTNVVRSTISRHDGPHPEDNQPRYIDYDF